MPKYSVDEVLDIIKTLTADEKSLLQEQLPNVLGTAAASATPQRGHTQSQSFDKFSMGSGNAFTANQAGGDVNSAQTLNNNQGSVQNASLTEALAILQSLKQEVNQSDALNRLEKTTVEGTIKVIQEELTKPKPDKSLVEQAIDSLKKGLEGVLILAEPVTKVAALVAKAWMI
ncbi:MAG TPA: hypothetical protein V6D48_21115 [Oculatellaceae cyanobacterium]